MDFSVRGRLTIFIILVVWSSWGESFGMNVHWIYSRQSGVAWSPKVDAGGTRYGRSSAAPTSLLLAKIETLFEEGPDDSSSPAKVAGGPTDEELKKTNGYEGSFKVGDKVKVTAALKIWSVKPYTKEGFDASGLVGTVSALVLYGRKMKSLCSAITPIKVEFAPDNPSIAAKGLSFERKFAIHFCADELELA